MDFATHHLSQKNPDEKEENFESGENHVVADMYFSCLCGHVLLLVACTLRHVLDFRSSPVELFPFFTTATTLSSFPFPVFPNRNDETFTVKHFSVDEMVDFSDGDFPVLTHHFLIYICKLT